jgi:hypothetical protein
MRSAFGIAVEAQSCSEQLNVEAARGLLDCDEDPERVASLVIPFLRRHLTLRTAGQCREDR